MNNEMIKKVRAFNRYYTTWLDVMNKDYMGTKLSWPESRILYEIYTHLDITATEICKNLNMDKSYVSRIIGKFEKNKFLVRELVVGTKGVKKIQLTKKGLKEAEKIDKNGDKQIVDKFKNMDCETSYKLCEAIELIEKILRENDEKGGYENE